MRAAIMALIVFAALLGACGLVQSVFFIPALVVAAVAFYLAYRQNRNGTDYDNEPDPRELRVARMMREEQDRTEKAAKELNH